MATNEELRERVRSHYAAAALSVSTGQGTASCCEGQRGSEKAPCSGPSLLVAHERFGSGLNSPAEHGSLPVAAVAASLGCGNPTAVAELREGDRVLDLGSGGGIDVLLSARRVGPHGFAYGVDMTDEMLALAEQNKVKAGLDNVAFLKGTIEDVP